jgi:TRAP-type mannitol/chloroaromatic compound transport system substrate-binding protein
VIKWTIVSKNPTIQPVFTAMKKALEETVKTMTDGGLQITLAEPGSVVAANGEWAAVQAGTIEGALTTEINNKAAFGAPSGLFTEFALSPPPDVWMAWYLYGDGLKLAQQLIDKTPGFDKVLNLGPFSASGAEVELNSKKPINTVADLKGMKIRTFGDWGKVLSDLGASVVGTPAGEVYEALQRGVLDACELSDRATNLAYGLHEVAKYWYYPGVHAPSALGSFYVNKDAFGKLPASYQEILRMVQKSVLAYNFVMIEQLNVEATPKILAAGVQLLEEPLVIQATLAQGADKLWRSYAAQDPFFKQVYDNLMAFSEAYGTYYRQSEPDIPMLLKYKL